MVQYLSAGLVENFHSSVLVFVTSKVLTWSRSSTGRLDLYKIYLVQYLSSGLVENFYGLVVLFRTERDLCGPGLVGWTCKIGCMILLSSSGLVGNFFHGPVLAF